MEHYVKWQLENELREIVFKNTASKKTLWNKLKKSLSENDNLFKLRDEETTYKGVIDKLKRVERCFYFIKSGFFKSSDFEGSYSLTEIGYIESFANRKELTLKDKRKITISEQDYFDLKFLLNN